MEGYEKELGGISRKFFFAGVSISEDGAAQRLHLLLGLFRGTWQRLPDKVMRFFNGEHYYITVVTFFPPPT